MRPSDSVAAIILCGGRSLRMGRDKALLPVSDEVFLERICRIVTPAAGVVIVAAAEDQKVPELGTHVRVVTDLLPDAGPLAGLLTGLQELRRLRPELTHAWLAGCDAPFVCPPVIARLRKLIGNADAVVVEHRKQLQPLGALYNIRILSVVSRLIESGRRSLHQLLQEIECTHVEAESFRDLDPELAFLRNINTPEDYERYIIAS